MKKQRIHIDSRIHAAILAFKADSGMSNAEIGKYVGCTGKHVNGIISGGVSSLSAEMWERFLPKLKPHLADIPEQMSAPRDPKRRFVASNLDRLSDARITELIMEIVERGGTM